MCFAQSLRRVNFGQLNLPNSYVALIWAFYLHKSYVALTYGHFELPNLYVAYILRFCGHLVAVQDDSVLLQLSYWFA